MSLFALICVCLSAICHASWNLLSKKNNPSAEFFIIAMCYGFCLTAPLLWVYSDVYVSMNMAMYGGFMATACAQVLYFTSLAAAYRHGDMSIAYPLARAFPLLLVTGYALVSGQAEVVSWLCIAGVCCIVAGTFLLPMKHARDFRLENYRNRMTVYALLAACGTALYSIIDNAVLQSFEQLPMALSAWDKTCVYLPLQALAVSSIGLSLSALRGVSRRRLRMVVQTQKKATFIVAVVSYLTYIFVLLAYQHAEDVSYVVAFRQLSIPLGALLGVYILKEQAAFPKLIGVAIIVTGLMMVALG